MTTTSRSAQYARWVSIPAGLVISALLIWQASHAAFADRTVNDDNTWSAGHVEITHDDSATAMFTAENLAPGDWGQKSVVATYSGTLAAEASLYGEDFSSSNELAKHLRLEIVATTSGFGAAGTTVSYPVFTGTLAGFAAAHTRFDNGLRAPASPGDSVTLTFSYHLDPLTPSSAQGGTATIDFVGETRSRTN